MNVTLKSYDVRYVSSTISSPVIQWGWWRRAVQPVNSFNDTWYDEPTGRMTIDFDRPVRHVRIRIYNADLVGHRVQAYSATNALLGAYEFTPGGDPTTVTFDWWDEGTIGIDSIRRVELLPVSPPPGTAADVVQYEVWFVPQDTSSCPPVTGIPMLDDPDFRPTSDSLLSLSKIVNKSPQSRTERLAHVFKHRLTGEFRYEIQSIVGTPCSVTIGYVADTDTETFEGYIHTHPFYQGDDVKVACGKPDATPINNKANGGGSEADWAEAQRLGRPVVAVSPQFIHYLPTWFTTAQRNKNPHRWRRDGRRHCPIPI